MRKRACIRATTLLAGRTAGLSDAARLELEHHLEACDSCAADERDVYLLVAGTGAAGVPQLTERGRERAIAAALRGGVTVQTEPIWDSRRRWLAPGLATAAAAAVIAVVVVTGDDSSDRAPVADNVARVIAGDVTTPAGPLREGAEIQAGVELTADKGATLVVGHARVELDAPSVLVWHPDRSTVSLRKGVLVATVDPGPKREFRVETDDFAVEVLGTRFEITPESVYVIEGKVRVMSPDGEVWADEIAAGESWFKPTLASSDKHRKARKRRKAERVDVPALLDSARARLAAGDVGDARAELERVLDARPTRANSAEARTLLAECALVEGKHSKAVDMYLEVAERYRKLRAGENALFAAARLEARSGAPPRARKLLARYLDRYPDGRFVDEAEHRLDELQ